MFSRYVLWVVLSVRSNFFVSLLDWYRTNLRTIWLPVLRACRYRQRISYLLFLRISRIQFRWDYTRDRKREPALVFWLSRRSLEKIAFVLVPVSVLALVLAPVPILTRVLVLAPVPVLVPVSVLDFCSWVCVFQLFILNFPSQKFFNKACLWGAGGAAQAVLYALLTLRVKEILVINRTLDKARGMIVGVERGKKFFFVSGSFILSRGLVVGDGKRIRSRLWPLC